MLFSKEDIETKMQTTQAEGQPSAFTSQYLNWSVEKINNADGLLRLPEDGEAIFLQTIQSFNAFSLVEMLSRQQFIQELVATTYSVSLSVLEALQELRSIGRLGSVTLLISDSMQQRNPRVCNAINAWAETNPDVKIIYTWNHSKITLAKTEIGYYCIEGSGNWSKNAQYEQYVFLQSQQVHQFRKELMDNCKIIHQIN